jgi:S1-C subfamily serine protease
MPQTLAGSGDRIGGVGRTGLGTGLAVAALVAVTLATRLVIALPLQDLVQRSKGRIAHLSVRDSSNEEQSSGSGFVISPDGQLATNFHVIDSAKRIVAVFSNGTEVDVVGVRGFDAEADIAVLQLKPGTYPALPLATVPAKTGDEIVVIGSPLGLGEAISTGIVSAVREHGTARPGSRPGKESWVLQISAAVASGSSGSPILNKEGEVVGLAVGVVRGEAMYFGVPVAKLQKLLEAGLGELKPLPEAREGWSVRTNILISTAFLAAIGFVWWLVTFLSRRGERRRGARALPGA